MPKAAGQPVRECLPPFTPPLVDSRQLSVDLRRRRRSQLPADPPAHEIAQIGIDLPSPVLAAGQQRGVSAPHRGEVLLGLCAPGQGGDHRRLPALRQREKGQEAVFLRAARLEDGVERRIRRSTGGGGGRRGANGLGQRRGQLAHVRRVAFHQAEEPVAVEAEGASPATGRPWWPSARRRRTAPPRQATRPVRATRRAPTGRLAPGGPRPPRSRPRTAHRRPRPGQPRPGPPRVPSRPSRPRGEPGSRARVPRTAALRGGRLGSAPRTPTTGAARRRAPDPRHQRPRARAAANAVRATGAVRRERGTHGLAVMPVHALISVPRREGPGTPFRRPAGATGGRPLGPASRDPAPAAARPSPRCRRSPGR